MVQLSGPGRTPATPGAPQAADARGAPGSSHDEQLLIAALERIELTRVALEELLNRDLSALLFA